MFRSYFRNFGARVIGTTLLLTLTSVGLCQDEPDQASQTEQEETIDEVTVYGTKTAHTLRMELYRAEEKVFAMFNELNLDDEYDIHCEERAPTGTRIKHRLCAPNFLRQASSEQDQFLWDPHFGGDVKSIPEMNRNLKLKMDALVAEQPDFRQAFVEYETAREHYEDRDSEDE